MSEIQDDTRPVRTTTRRTLLVIGDETILFDPDKLLVSEVVAIEDQQTGAGLTWPQVMGGLAIGAGSALRACVWIMRKRSNPKLKISDVEFAWGDITQEDPDVLAEYGGIPLGEAFGDTEVAEGNDDTAVSEDPKDLTEAPPEPA